MEFKRIDQKAWEKYPEPQPTKPANRWEDALVALEAGEIVEIAVDKDKAKGVRIGLARSASTRGFKLEFRYADGKLAVRRSDKPLVAREPHERKQRATKAPAETA